MNNSDGTGYTPEQINTLNGNLAEAYNNFGNVIADGWPAVQQTMQQYWVGEDEQSYEDAFCRRMCEMYVNAGNIVNQLVNNLKQLGHGWHEFQNKNIMSGASLPTSYPVNIEDITVSINEKIISFKEASVSNATARGIKAGALSAIQSAMESYLQDIKANVQNVYAEIDSSQAFIGAVQGVAITDYIKEIGESLGTVLTAANDIYQALQQLAQTAYTQSEEQVSSEFNASQVRSDIEGELGNMKWNG